MKRQVISDSEQFPTTTKAGKPAKSAKVDKASKTKVSAREVERVMNGRVKKASTLSKKRVARKIRTVGFAVVIENGSMSEDELVGEAIESEDHVKEQSTPEIAGLAIEANEMIEEEGHDEFIGGEAHMEQESTPEMAVLAIEGNGISGKEEHEVIHGSEMHGKEGTLEITAATDGDEMYGKDEEIYGNREYVQDAHDEMYGEDGLEEIYGNLGYVQNEPEEVPESAMEVDKASQEN
jgi:hypothetical protein